MKRSKSIQLTALRKRRALRGYKLPDFRKDPVYAPYIPFFTTAFLDFLGEMSEPKGTIFYLDPSTKHLGPD